MHRFELVARIMKEAYKWIANYERIWHAQLGSLETHLGEVKKREKGHRTK